MCARQVADSLGAETYCTLHMHLQVVEEDPTDTLGGVKLAPEDRRVAPNGTVWVKAAAVEMVVRRSQKKLLYDHLTLVAKDLSRVDATAAAWVRHRARNLKPGRRG